MNKKFLKSLLALFAVALLAISCADKPTDPEGDGETPDNTNLPELGIEVTEGAANSPLAVTLASASEEEDTKSRASAATQAEQKVTAKVTLGENITKGITYDVTGVSSLDADPSASARPGSGPSLVKITAQDAIDAQNYTVVEKVVPARTGATEVDLDVTLKAAALSAVATQISDDSKYGYIVLTLKATKAQHQSQENIKIYVKITGAAAASGGDGSFRR